jgi:hypothetical protein
MTASPAVLKAPSLGCVPVNLPVNLSREASLRDLNSKTLARAVLKSLRKLKTCFVILDTKSLHPCFYDDSGILTA